MKKNLDDLFKVPSPLELLDLESFCITDHEVFIKRDDLIHDVVSGNKWRKLKMGYCFTEIEQETELGSIEDKDIEEMKQNGMKF